MKKLLFVLCLIPVLLFCGCVEKQDKVLKMLTEETAAQINEDTNLQLKFLENVGGKDLSFLVPQDGWFGARGYLNSGYEEGDIYYVQYVITAYPDYADGGSVVTEIVCTDPNITFFGGYTVNDSEQLIEYLSNDGYAVEDGNSIGTLVRAKKGKITISFFIGDGYNEVMFMYEVGNRKGIVF